MNIQSHSAILRIMLGSSILLLLLCKVLLAARLDLYSDEIFYWLASTRLALAYSDLPFVTSLLVWLGSGLDPGNPLAVRALFIVMGSSIPLLVYWLALPITDRAHATCSALLAVCIPLGGFLGLLAVPDVPLLCFGLLAIGLFERALRTDLNRYWMATGIAVALGLSTHYRFLLYPAAAILFLVCYGPARHQLRNPKLWLAIFIACLGLAPIAWFNLSNQLASASFYLVERHPWEFQPQGLLHILKQAGLVTPPLYALLGLTLWQMIVRARSGNRNAAMLASFALTNLLVYMVLAPWTDSASTTIHWPLSGYFPLLVFVPASLEWLHQWLRSRFKKSIARKIVIGIPAIGLVGSFVALFGVGSQAFQLPLQALVGTGVLSNKMAGWNEFNAHTRHVLEQVYPGSDPLVVTDNYYTAAQLMFAGLDQEIFTVDNNKAVRDGRNLQLALWDMDTAALQSAPAGPILFITEDSTLNILEKEQVIVDMCHQVTDLRFTDSLKLFNGDKQFSYYHGGDLMPASTSNDYRAFPCPYPPRAWIDPPVAGATLAGIAHIEGWAYNEDIGVGSVELLIDGEPVAEVAYGAVRPDVVEVMNVQSDPNAPNLGYSYELDTLQFPNGSYKLAIRITDLQGTSSIYGERDITIAN